MATRVRIICEGPHHIIVGTPTSREFLRSGISTMTEVREHHPIVITEYESDMNEIGSIVLPEGFKQ